MISGLFYSAVYNPLYNALILLVDWMPGYSMGLAVIALTLFVRIILYPLSRSAIEAQKKIKAVTPHVEKIKEKHKDDRKAQSEAILALYREHNIRLSPGFVLLLVQLPILLALYWIFASGGLPAVDQSILYSFVPAPPQVETLFLGVVDLTGKSMLLALLVIVTQALYTRLSMGPRVAPAKPAGERSFAEDMAAQFDLQARYLLPVLFGVFAYYVAAAAPLFWVTGNLAMIAQEYWSGRRF